MADHLDIFISSTSQDLTDYRARVERQILQMNLQPIGMENFNPAAAGAVQKCHDELQEAEMFIGIYAYRYG
ncbi:MAG: DUF4062 domain-containing protein, partial [Anaerolineae bacterium]|nr:DUF4062 domain-containing protein [Anaerolineae bacterium]